MRTMLRVALEIPSSRELPIQIRVLPRSLAMLHQIQAYHSFFMVAR